MQANLQLIAGFEAKAHIDQYGLSMAMFTRIQAASGGPKWLAIAELDREIWRQWHAAGCLPMSAVGSSSGAWRMSALASGGDKAHERLQNAYIGFTANQRPSYADIEAQIRALLSKALDSNQRDKLCRGLDWHLSVVVSRARALSASGNKTRVGLGLAAAMLTNAFARRSLDWHFRRVVVSPEANSPWGGLSDMPTEQAPLTLDNLEEVLLATGSIPLLSAPVTAMAEIPAGHYFDGGISDYHFDQSVSGDGFTLFPHFLDGAYAGWFDKFFKRRKRPQNFSRTLMLVPSDSFVAALPGHKIPDRNDFARLSNDERRKRWQQAVEASTALALEWRELVEGKRTPVVKLV